MNFQEIMTKIREANEKGIEINPNDFHSDPKMVEYAKKLNETVNPVFDEAIAKKQVGIELNRITMLSDRKFMSTENNKPVLQALFYWFCNNPHFAGHCENFPDIFNNRPSLKKGILLTGGVGTGKSTMISAFQNVWFPGKSFKAKSCKDIALLTKPERKQLYIGNWYFDELGNEKPGYKDECIMTDILEERYYKRTFIRGQITAGFTIVSTNLTLSQIGEKYGERVMDRVREMFNIIYVKGGSFRD